MSEAAVISIRRGNPTSEEVAALVGVLLARPGPAAGPVHSRPVSHWWASGLAGAVGRPGPDAWRIAALPR